MSINVEKRCGKIQKIKGKKTADNKKICYNIEKETKNTPKIRKTKTYFPVSVYLRKKGECVMYDVKKIMQERPLLSPLPTPDPAKFPRDEEVPEGCHVLENLADGWG